MNIDEYFEKIWKPNIDQYRYTGWKLLDHVSDTDMVLDVGCGYNLFKPHLGDQLVAIDPYNNAADQRVSIEDFQSDIKFDVIFCLGSINFGSEENILNQIEKVTSLCKTGTRIYWRQNPGRKDHKNKECESIDFFDWSFERNLEYAKKFGFQVEMLAWDNGKRIFAKWIKQDI